MSTRSASWTWTGVRRTSAPAGCTRPMNEWHRYPGLPRQKPCQGVPPTAMIAGFGLFPAGKRTFPGMALRSSLQSDGCAPITMAISHLCYQIRQDKITIHFSPTAAVAHEPTRRRRVVVQTQAAALSSCHRMSVYFLGCTSVENLGAQVRRLTADCGWSDSSDRRMPRSSPNTYMGENCNRLH
ncbi:hypothetical protein BD309DRAFT_80270 [Dichomitus squalens]|nr:hypothetical protein BD309DRAFT_80270 [Dichomitus squalens]